MANTGYLVYTKLLKVSDDANEQPLDVNNIPTSISGLPQATKENAYGSADYIPKVYNTNTCPISVKGTFINVDTNKDSSTRLFVDVDLLVYRNNVLLSNIHETQNFEYFFNIGDVVRVVQQTNPEANPWPPNSNSSLRVLKNGTVISQQSKTTQDWVLASYEFTVSAGDYIIESTGSSSANNNGWRKYKFLTNIATTGVIDVEDVVVTLSDDTTTNVFQKAIRQNTESEFNMYGLSGTMTIAVVNERSTSITVTLQNYNNTYTSTQTIAGGTTGTFPSLAKQSYSIIASV